MSAETERVDKECMEATKQYRDTLYSEYGVDKAKKEEAIELEEALAWQIDGFDDGYIKAAESILAWNPVSRLPPTGTVCFLAVEDKATKEKFVVRALYSDGTDLTVADKVDGQKSTKKKGARCPKGWYEWNLHDEVHWGLEQTPLYWMLIPPIPSTTSASALIRN